MLAAIDVGSNTVRMLLGEVSGGQVQPYRYERIITRLKGGQTSRGLAPASMERTLAALQHFAEIAGDIPPDRIATVGTEALRSSVNGPDFCRMVRLQTGLDIQIIGGEEEGSLSCAGAMSVLDPVPGKAVIVDIGGGSTEIVLIVDRSVVFRHSCPLGVVHLAEMGLCSLRRQLINEHLDSLVQSMPPAASRWMMDPETLFVGTAGTITTLAALDLRMTDYDWRRVNNHRLNSEKIDHFLDKLKSLSLPAREALPGMERGRGDLIIPGLEILQQLMLIFRKNELIVSDSGLLEGLLLQLAERAAID